MSLPPGETQAAAPEPVAAHHFADGSAGAHATALFVGLPLHALAVVMLMGVALNFTNVIARDLAPFGVRVNALAPGFVMTPLTSDLREGASSRMERAAQRTLLKRVAEPDDVVGPLLRGAAAPLPTLRSAD